MARAMRWPGEDGLRNLRFGKPVAKRRGVRSRGGGGGVVGEGGVGRGGGWVGVRGYAEGRERNKPQ